MSDPTEVAWYFIYTGVAWECALWDGELWNVIGRDYAMTAKEVGITEWRGPIQMPDS